MDRQIDETDAALLAALAEDARASVAALARRLGIARTTVQARIERLESRGVIAGYTLRTGARMRPALRATVLVSIEPRSGPAVLARLKALPGVEAAHTTSGRVDMILEVVADTTEALDRTLDRIGEVQGVKSSESLIHLSTKIDRR
ncbi:Regulatory protein AsnC [Roseivivax jejudonensis]|uniref:Regulatory protein AsnC n=1 Tax=Roseivivax jejudonensis TaxID=1529041 RepID=A0A1X6ZI65_9RHOB|nr:Lrp/AsnC family transcriptional regulator [Roseivivax jejudonensis]SLN51781.1 Regulatory protein AsnC [Roseivivax jejudonensis]